MEAKENRPDACTASGTAKPIYKYSSTDTPDIQEELTGPCELIFSGTVPFLGPFL